MVAYWSLVVLAKILPLLDRRVVFPLLRLQHIQGHELLLCESLSLFEIHVSDIEAFGAVGAGVSVLATPETHGGARVFWSRRRGRAGCGGDVPRGVRWGRDRRSIPRNRWRGIREPRRKPAKHAITGGRRFGVWGGPRSRSKRFVRDAI